MRAVPVKPVEALDTLSAGYHEPAGTFVNNVRPLTSLVLDALKFTTDVCHGTRRTVPSSSRVFNQRSTVAASPAAFVKDVNAISSESAPGKNWGFTNALVADTVSLDVAEAQVFAAK